MIHMPDGSHQLTAERGPCAGAVVTVRDGDTDVRLDHPTDGEKRCRYIVLPGPEGPRLLYEANEPRRTPR